MNVTVQITARSAQATADEINEMFSAGAVTMAGGRELVSRHGQPVATAWQNGTVSVTVRGRERGKVGEIFAKADTTLVLS